VELLFEDSMENMNCNSSNQKLSQKIFIWLNLEKIIKLFKLGQFQINFNLDQNFVASYPKSLFMFQNLLLCLLS